MIEYNDFPQTIVRTRRYDPAFAEYWDAYFPARNESAKSIGETANFDEVKEL